MPSTSSGAQTKPVTPSSMISGSPPTLRRDDRDFAGHRFERRQSKALLRRRQQEQIGDRQLRHQVVLLADEADVVRSGPIPPRAVRCRHRDRDRRRPAATAPRTRRRISRKTSSTASTRLTGAEVRHVDHQRIAAIGRAESRAQRRLGPAAVLRAIEEIRNHADVTAHAQRGDRVCLQALRHRGDAVRLLDGERDDPRVRRVAADQRDVGAVQRRDRARRPSCRAAAQDLARQIRRRRVGNGVVRVHDVETALRATRARSCWSAPADIAARGTADRAAPRPRSNDKPGMPARQRNGGSLLMTWTWWPRRRERIAPARSRRRRCRRPTRSRPCRCSWQVLQQRRTAEPAPGRRSLRRRRRRPARQTARRGSR